MGAPEVAAAKAAWAEFREQRARNALRFSVGRLTSYIELRGAQTALNAALDILRGPELASIQPEGN
jgi:hypothetical protein